MTIREFKGWLKGYLEAFEGTNVNPVWGPIESRIDRINDIYVQTRRLTNVLHHEHCDDHNPSITSL